MPEARDSETGLHPKLAESKVGDILEANRERLPEPPSLDGPGPLGDEEPEPRLTARRCEAVRLAAHDGVSCLRIALRLSYVGTGMDALAHVRGDCDCDADVPPKPP